MVQSCPDLQEIGIKHSVEFGKDNVIAVSPPLRSRNSYTYCFVWAKAKLAENLRSLKHLAVVELDCNIRISFPWGVKPEEVREKRKALTEKWTRLLIPILKDSPSKERKFLKWKFYELHWRRIRWSLVSARKGMLEVLPETPLVA